MLHPKFQYHRPFGLLNTVKSVVVATSTKQITRFKQACIHFPKIANTLKCTCVKQAPVLTLLYSEQPKLYGGLAVLSAIGVSKDILIIL